MKIISAEEAGKNKSLFFVFRLFLLLPILLLAVFCCKEVLADSHLIINEIQTAGQKTDNDFVELYNPTDKKINLKDFKIVKRAKNGTNDTLIKSWTSDEYIQSEDYYLWANNHDDFSTLIKANVSTGATLAKDNSIAIKNKATDIIIDSVGWGICQNDFIENLPALNPSENRSIERINFQDTDNNSEDFVILETPTPTPAQKENIDDEKNTSNDSDSSNKNNFIDEKSPYADQIKINEIFPAPDTKAGEKEFVELLNNGGGEAVDFSKWCIRDETQHAKSDGGSCKSVSAEQKEKFISLSGSFSLNSDSKGDTVYLYDENKKLVAAEKYTGAKKGCYYALDDDFWRWTSQGTPGTENKFDSEVSAKITRDKTVSSNVYAYFSAAPNDAVKKLSWQFGDGHGSTLKETKHKFTKAKKYAASLTVSGVCEIRTYDFQVNVEKYTAPKIRIVKISPNPKGSDTENEWIEIQNSSKKKINLKGWSIATGWENFYNHPIREDFIIKAGKTKKLGRDICAFTLANTKTKLELRNPSGKAVQKVEYDSGKKSIQEDALYQKESGSNWEWSKSSATVGANLVSDQDTQKPAPTEAPPSVPAIPSADLGKYSPNPAWRKKQNYQIELANFNSKLKIPGATTSNQPQVLGAHALPYDGTYYIFTQTIPQKHWLLKFYGNIWLKINSQINKVLNIF